VRSDQWYPCPGVLRMYAKGDAGARMRMHVNRKELEEIAGGQERSEKRRGAEGTSKDVHSS